jgi:hypothetical protein
VNCGGFSPGTYYFGDTGRLVLQSLYKNDAQCDWFIRPAGSDAIKLSFTLESLENNFDYVTVWTCLDAGCRDMQSTARMTGSQTQTKDVWVIGPAAFVEFSSDSKVTGNFRFSWQFVNKAVSP